MEKINTPIMALIETRKKYIKDLESLPEWDRRTRQVLRWHKDELSELEKMLLVEREVIEKSHLDGQKRSHSPSKEVSEIYFTQTFKSYE